MSSDFLIVRPTPVDDAALDSSSVPETVPVYNPATSYDTGDRVRSDATHRVYESLTDANVGNDLDDPANWVDIGPTNRWAMFDEQNSTQTIADNEIEVVFSPGQRVDIIGLLNIYAHSARVIAEDAGEGVVYDRTFSLVDDSAIIDWYSYFTEPFNVAGDKVISELPALYSGLTFTVSLSYAGQEVRCGALIAGLAKVVGATLAGATTGIINYSRRVVDEFGNASFVERGYANRGNFRVFCENSNIVSVQRLLADYRAAPALYVGTEEFANTFIFGTFRDFAVAIDHPHQSYLNIELEGLI
jgi:hypothetical protein